MPWPRSRKAKAMLTSGLTCLMIRAQIAKRNRGVAASPSAPGASCPPREAVGSVDHPQRPDRFWRICDLRLQRKRTADRGTSTRDRSGASASAGDLDLVDPAGLATGPRCRPRRPMYLRLTPLKRPDRTERRVVVSQSDMMVKRLHSACDPIFPTDLLAKGGRATPHLFAGGGSDRAGQGIIR